MNKEELIKYFEEGVEQKDEDYEKTWENWCLAEDIINYFDDYMEEYNALSDEDKEYIIDYLQYQIDRKENEELNYLMLMESKKDLIY
jgi:hypothetical protein